MIFIGYFPHQVFYSFVEMLIWAFKKNFFQTSIHLEAHWRMRSIWPGTPHPHWQPPPLARHVMRPWQPAPAAQQAIAELLG